MKANLYALAAIGLWASLAALGVALKHVPPFLLTGIALCSERGPQANGGQRVEIGLHRPSACPAC